MRQIANCILDYYCEKVSQIFVLTRSDTCSFKAQNDLKI